MIPSILALYNMEHATIIINESNLLLQLERRATVKTAMTASRSQNLKEGTGVDLAAGVVVLG